MSTTTIDVAGYAAAVRAALTGLGPEQVEDLTDGLEANLADALADEGRGIVGQSAEEVFGPAAEYAQELLVAAGLTGVLPTRRRRRLGEIVDAPFLALARRARRLLDALRTRPGWPAFEEFALVLRPVWWVLRAWVLWQMTGVLTGDQVGAPLPTSALGAVLLGAFVVGSVQWGRGRWPTRGVWHRVLLVVSAVAVLAAFPTLARASTPVVRTNWIDSSSSPSDGVVVDGAQATNLFVYDGDGNPVPSAQVYDQDGRPVRVLANDYGGYPSGGQWWAFAPATSGGESRWNVYPMLAAPMTQWTTGADGVQQLTPDAQPSAPWPFAKAPVVVVPQGSTVTAGPDGATSAAPSAGAQPSGAATAPALDASAPAGAAPSATSGAVPSGPAATAAG